jgi:hypothetical protein
MEFVQELNIGWRRIGHAGKIERDFNEKYSDWLYAGPVPASLIGALKRGSRHRAAKCCVKIYIDSSIVIAVYSKFMVFGARVFSWPYHACVLCGIKKILKY